MLRGTCPRCQQDIKVSWKDRPEDKGVGRSQLIVCPVCCRQPVEMTGKGGT